MMTYYELIGFLESLTPEQLKKPVIGFDTDNSEDFFVTQVFMCDGDPFLSLQFIEEED